MALSKVPRDLVWIVTLCTVGQPDHQGLLHQFEPTHELHSAGTSGCWHLLEGSRMIQALDSRLIQTLDRRL